MDTSNQQVRRVAHAGSLQFLYGLLACGFLAAGPAVAVAGTRIVTPGPGAIGAAITASAEGDIIRVRAGVYSENVVIDKRLTVIGEEGAVIDAGGQGHVLVVGASDVRVEDLTMRNCGNDIELSEAGIRIEQDAADALVKRNRVEACRFGIWIHGSERARIVDNEVLGMKELAIHDRGDCIHLWDTRHAEIRGNTISNCRDGIYMELSRDCEIVGNTILDSRYSVHTMWCDRSTYNDNTASGNLVGLALMFSKGIEAKRNILYDNTTHGILLTQVTRSEASDNIVIGNSKGMFVYNSLYNTLRDNFVARNNLGMHYWGGSEDNEVSENTFMANEIQVKFVAARDQRWDGNYWSDYLGWDVDGNGQGDVPYRSNTLVDSLLWKFPMAKLLLASPALQLLTLAEREFPIISVPKGIDAAPQMQPLTSEWSALLERYPSKPKGYYGTLAKLPHVPGEHR
jgi:nitrous oxidase accessory protein